MKKTILINLLFFYFFYSVQAQVKIGDNPTIINNTAVLELESTNKGLLIPRLTTPQMNAISNPPLGLFIFNITDSLFYLRLDSGWTKIATGVNQWGNTDANIFNLNSGNVGVGTSAPAQKLHVNGSVQIDSAIYIPNTTSSTNGVIYIGGVPFIHSAGNQLQQNVFIGRFAGSFDPNVNNKKNVAVGEYALNNAVGADNVAIGWAAANMLTGGENLTESLKNTFVGYRSGANATGGVNNVSLGVESGFALQAGSVGNVLLGPDAGFATTTGTGNVLVGNNVQTSTGSFNTGVGGNSGTFMADGIYNTWLGSEAFKNNKSGIYNTVLGAAAARDDSGSTSQFNVYLGAFSALHTQGTNNVFIGSFSGMNDQANLVNTFILNNNSNTTHLINGKFDTHKVGINIPLSNLDYTLDVGGEIRIGSLPADPPAANGVMYYNSTTNKLRAVENNVWTDIINPNNVINSSSNPTASQIPNGTYQVWKNTSTNSIYIWVNDNGTMKKIQFL